MKMRFFFFFGIFEAHGKIINVSFACRSSLSHIPKMRHPYFKCRKRRSQKIEVNDRRSCYTTAQRHNNEFSLFSHFAMPCHAMPWYAKRENDDENDIVNWLRKGLYQLVGIFSYTNLHSPTHTHIIRMYGMYAPKIYNYAINYVTATSDIRSISS